MITYRTAIVISLGVFLGLLCYGVQTTMTNYNTLVNPQRQLKIISIQEKSGEVDFMGEEVKLFQPDVYNAKEIIEIKLAGIKEAAGDMCQQLLEEYNEFKRKS